MNSVIYVKNSRRDIGPIKELYLDYRDTYENKRNVFWSHFSSLERDISHVVYPKQIQYCMYIPNKKSWKIMKFNLNVFYVSIFIEKINYFFVWR